MHRITQHDDPMPPKLYQLAKAVSEQFQTDTCLAITCILGMAASTAQKNITVEVSDSSGSSYPQPLCLFLVAIAKPSSGKSPLFNYLRSPLDLIVEKHNIEMQDIILKDESIRKTRAQEIKRLRQKIVRIGATSSQRQMLENDLFELEKLLKQPKIVPVRLFLQDTTAKAAMNFLDKQESSLTIADHEGVIFDALNEHRLLEVLLNGFSGDPTSFERSSTASLDIVNPRISLCVLTQEAKLKRMSKKTNFGDEGFLPRCLIYFARTLRSRKPMGTPVPEHLRKYWEERLKLLFNFSYLQPNSGINPHVLRFSDEAARAWEEIVLDFDNYNYGDTRILRAWHVKMKGVLARIAAIYHLFESDNPFEESIPVERIREAAVLLFIAKENMVKVYSLFFPDKTMICIKKIINWLEREGRTINNFSVREVYRTLGLTVEDTYQACNSLKIWGVLEGSMERVKEVGRRHSPFYHVNYRELDNYRNNNTFNPRNSNIHF